MRATAHAERRYQRDAITHFARAPGAYAAVMLQQQRRAPRNLRDCTGFLGRGRQLVGPPVKAQRFLAIAGWIVAGLGNTDDVSGTRGRRPEDKSEKSYRHPGRIPARSCRRYCSK
jgi:hypothetical protein